MTKLATLRELIAAGDFRAALKLAASFSRLGEQRAAIERGWNAFANPETYREMGNDPERLIAAGVAALRERYPEPTPQR